MPCCRCSIPTATPPAASGRDWTSCDSGWGPPARPAAGPGPPRGRRRGRGSAGPRALPAPGRGSRPHARRPARPGGADETGRPGRGATRQRVGDRRGRAGLVGVVDRVVGSVLPAAAVRQGGRRVQRTLRPGRGKRGVTPRDHRGGTGAAGGDVRGEPVSATRVAHWLWGASPAARVARVPLS